MATTHSIGAAGEKSNNNNTYLKVNKPRRYFPSLLSSLLLSQALEAHKRRLDDYEHVHFRKTLSVTTSRA